MDNKDYLFITDKTKRQEMKNISNETPLIFSIDYEKSYRCQPNKKEHLVVYCRAENKTSEDIITKASIFPRGKLVSSIAEPGYHKRIASATIWVNRPQIVVSATLTDMPHTLKSFSIEDVTLIIVGFNTNDNMSLSIFYDGVELSIPIVLKDIKYKHI